MAGWDWETPPAGGPDLTDEVEALDDRVTALEGAGGGSSLDYFFSPVGYAVAKLTGDMTGGNWAPGCTFRVTRAATIAKVRFAWPKTQAGSVKVSVWNEAGTRVANTTVSANAAGVYEGTVSVAVGSGDLYKVFAVSAYVVGGTEYATYPFASYPLTNNPYVASPALIMIANNLFGSGDVLPNQVFSEWSAVEPVLE